MAANTKHPPGPPMKLANMREQGVRNLIGYCLNDACRHRSPVLCLAESSAERSVTIFRVFEPDSALQYWVEAPSERDARQMVSTQIPALSEEEIECRIDTPDLPVPYGVVVVSRKTKEQSENSN